MAKDNRDDATKEHHREQVSELALKGWTQRRIAAHLGISLATVSRDLAVVKKRWQESSVENIEAIKARELARLELLMLEAMAAYEKSRQPTKTATQTDKGSDQTKTVKVEERVGNARYLELALKISEQIRKLVGADAPQQIDHTLEVVYGERDRY